MNKKTFVIVAHVVLILLAYTAPFWLDWRFVAAGVILNYIQILIFKGCVLSLAQFEDKKQTFHEWYLRKIGLKPNRLVLNFILRYIIPFIILGVAVLYQLIFKISVLVSF